VTPPIAYGGRLVLVGVIDTFLVSSCTSLSPTKARPASLDKRSMSGFEQVAPFKGRWIGDLLFLPSLVEQAAQGGDEEKPRPGRPGLNGQKAGCRGCGERLRSEFTLTAASLSVPPHSIAKDRHAP
jgi:hypothetical protein